MRVAQKTIDANPQIILAEKKEIYKKYSLIVSVNTKEKEIYKGKK